MRFNGEYVLKSDRGTVWTFLTDPGAVSACIPDVEEVQVLDGGNFNAVAKVGIGFIRQKFKFKFTLTNLSEPTHAELDGRGAGAGSMIDFRSKVDLVELDESKTKLIWSAEVAFMGPLGGMASRFVPDAAAVETRRLFDCVRARVEATKPGQ